MSTQWTRPDTRFLFDEIGLFVRPFSSLNREPWKTRLDRWKAHIDVLATIRVGCSVETLQKGPTLSRNPSIRQPPCCRSAAFCRLRHLVGGYNSCLPGRCEARRVG